MKTTATKNTTSGFAYYFNSALNETYRIGMEDCTTARAWNLGTWVCQRNGWNTIDLTRVSIRLTGDTRPFLVPVSDSRNITEKIDGLTITKVNN
jgi:hypothetical protein